MTKKISELQPLQSNVEAQNTCTPCLIQCRQGVCVYYKERYLYSKYDPAKAIVNLISSLEIKSDTLILIFSPCLWLGLNELLQKISSSNKIAAFEFDKNLYNFSSEILQNNFSPFKNSDSFINFFNNENISDFINFIQKNHLKRVLKIDFSAGVNFCKTQYEQIFKLSESVINQFWKNRLTLIKFGRNYSKNIFKNLLSLSNSIPFEIFSKKIEKPILVLGAGESLDFTILELKKIFLKNERARKNIFIICVDAALNPLLENAIFPDAVVSVESQLAIEKAFIGRAKSSKILLFCDLVNRSSIKKIVGGDFCYFLSNFSNLNFFEKLKQFDIMPPLFAPMGSVGLVAMEIALRLHASSNTNILFSGLDFSYSLGITHAKKTMAHKNFLMSTNRLKSIFNFDAAFGEKTQKIVSKDNRVMITSVALKNYALLFIDLFSSEKNIFDASRTGIDLHFEKINLENFLLNNKFERFQNQQNFTNQNQQNNFSKEKILTFIKSEKTELEKLKDILINGDNSIFRDKNILLSEQIEREIFDKEYLFIHFADAYKMPRTQSFYNRIRIEIDFFLKIFSLKKS